MSASSTPIFFIALKNVLEPLFGGFFIDKIEILLKSFG